MSLKINGTTYNVNVTFGSMTRSFSVLSGCNAGVMLDKTEFADVVGTSISYTFTIEPDAAHRTDYDTLYEVLTTPANSITIQDLPYNQTTISFAGRVVGATDKYNGQLGSVRRWKGLTITVKSLAPYKTA